MITDIFKKQQKTKDLSQEKNVLLIMGINKALKDKDKLLENEEKLSSTLIKEWKEKYNALFIETDKQHLKALKNAPNFVELQKAIQLLSSALKTLEIKIVEQKAKEIIEEIDVAINKLNNYFIDKNTKVTNTIQNIWIEEHQKLLLILYNQIKEYKETPLYENLIEKKKEILEQMEYIPTRILEHNLKIDLEEIQSVYILDKDIFKPNKILNYENVIKQWKEKYINWFIFFRDENIKIYNKTNSLETLQKEKLKFLNYAKSLKVLVDEHNISVILKETRKAFAENDLLFRNKYEFISESSIALWKKNNQEIIDFICSDEINKYSNTKVYPELIATRMEMYKYLDTLKNKIKKHNEHVVENKQDLIDKYIGKVEGINIDKQQMQCVLLSPQNHLVIAGAGSGKTTTILAKIKFLLNCGALRPEDLLVISFTNASATELKNRIFEETKKEIDISTFHKLGLNIITTVDNITPNITKLNLHKFIKEQLEELIKSDIYLKELNRYLLSCNIIPKSEFEFSNQEEYQNYLKNNPPTAMNGEIFKSYGEMDIANFLIFNGIEYKYEEPYKIDTRTTKYGQYHPDFYLPEYDMYIEYFGIDKEGNPPSYFAQPYAYKQGIIWKKQLHKENKTKLIDLYAYEKENHSLMVNLKKKLLEFSVNLNAKTQQEIWEIINNNDNNILDGIVELFATTIHLIKNNNYTLEDVLEINKTSSNKRLNELFLYLLNPIFKAYEWYLKENNEIDFNDMINLATQYVKDGKYKNNYKFVIIDEYQDISKSRYNLIKALRDSHNFKLFCVGDDWQSIYQFTGSDIDYIVNFEKYWGNAEISKIETTYRFDDNIIKVSGDFIMKNPRQHKKEMTGKSSTDEKTIKELFCYNDKVETNLLIKNLESLEENSTVYLLGRYNFDIKLLNNINFTYKYNIVSGFTDVTLKSRPDLKINFLTIHKSKGLQADYVFILNNKNSTAGFPSKIQNAPILKLLLENSDSFKDAEERRLFYVALTRTKKKCFLLTQHRKESEFIRELKESFPDYYERDLTTCPKCGGELVKRDSEYGEFIGCSNFSSLNCTYKENC